MSSDVVKKKAPPTTPGSSVSKCTPPTDATTKSLCAIRRITHFVTLRRRLRVRAARGWLRIQHKIRRVSEDTVTSGVRPAVRVEAWRARVLASPASFAVVALTVLAAVLRFAWIGRQGFWVDEGYTAMLVHLSPGKMLALIPKTESTPPLYYCVAWVLGRVFGYGEAGLRSLSAIAGVATVPVAYAAARKLISNRAGLIAAALTACSPLMIWYSQEARSYSLLVLLTAVSLLAFAYARARPTTRMLIAWVVASGLALATHYYALLAIAPQAVWLLAAHGRRRSVQVGVGVVGLCGLALLPLAISQNGTDNASWIGLLPLGLRLDQFIRQFLIGFQAPAQGLIEGIAAAITIVGLLLLMVSSDAIEQRGAFVAGGLAVGGFALGLLMIAGGIDNVITRNMIALWLPAALVVAAGLGARRAGVLGILAAAALCATGIVAAVGVAADRNFQRPDWRVVARVLGTRAAPGVGARAILIERYGELLPLSLYLPGLNFWRHNRATGVTELDIISFTVPWVPMCWWGAACYLIDRGSLRPPPAQRQSFAAVPGFHQVWRRRAAQFTLTRLVSPTPVTLTRLTVSRGLTRTALRRDALMIQR
jgi:mannosyltransferase